MRLIDADALKQSIREIMPSRTEVNILIDAQPDAIVRCKDCRHYTGGIDGYCNLWCRRSGGELSFCQEGNE